MPAPDPLQTLVNGALGPLSRLRDTIDLTLDQVSEWIAHPDNRRQISNLVTLLDAQTQLIICQHRLIAAARLADVASSQASPETVRRACSDLLKLRLIDPYKEDKRPVKLPPPPEIDQEKVLETLEQIGKMSLARLRGDPSYLDEPPLTELTRNGAAPSWPDHDDPPSAPPASSNARAN
jgi:hypothetical protein